MRAEVRRAVRGPCRHLAVGGELEEARPQEAHRRFHLGEVHEPPCAGLIAVVQRRHQRRHHQVGRGEVRVQRPQTDGRSVRQAGDHVEPSEGDDAVAVGAVVAVRALRAHHRHRQHDDVRLDLAQVFVTQAPARHALGGVVVQDDVRALDDLFGQFDAAGRVHVQAQRQLVRVAVVEDAVCVQALLAGRLGAHHPDVVQAVLRLDLDDLCPEVGQDARRGRAGDHPGEVRHADSGQGLCGVEWRPACLRHPRCREDPAQDFGLVLARQRRPPERLRPHAVEAVGQAAVLQLEAKLRVRDTHEVGAML